MILLDTTALVALRDLRDELNRRALRELAVVAGVERRARVWTDDRELRTTWRRLDGTRIPLAGA